MSDERHLHRRTDGADPALVGAVLHAVNRLSDRGDGIANVCVDLVCAQRARGMAVGVATVRGGFTDLVDAHDVRLFDVDFRIRSPQMMWRALRGLRSAIRLLGADVVHAHTLAATVVARVAVIGTRTAVVATVHNEYQRGVVLMGVAHRVVGVSAAVSRAMRRRGVPPRRIRTVLNGTIGSVRRSAPEFVDGPQPAVVAIGAVSHRKGSDVLLEAFRRVIDSIPEAQLYFVGNVDWQQIADRAAGAALAGRVHFTGFDAAPQRHLGGERVFVLPSRRDPAPLALIEAMEAGAPIIASDVDGVPEILERGAFGLLVPAEDADSLADAIVRVLSDPELRRDLRERSARGAVRFSLQRVVDEYNAVYGELVADRTRGAARRSDSPGPSRGTP